MLLPQCLNIISNFMVFCGRQFISYAYKKLKGKLIIAFKPVQNFMSTKHLALSHPDITL